jgi:transposase
MDAAGIHLAMTRLLGRAPRGARVVAAVPQHYGPNVTRIGALSLQGRDAVMTVDGATDGAVLRASVAQVLGPTLVAGAIVLMDNLGAHKVAGIREALAERGAQGQDLPPSSPDLSPIAPCWSKSKTAWWQAKARTREAREQALEQGLSTVTAIDARHWFTHCGYPIQ